MTRSADAPPLAMLTHSGLALSACRAVYDEGHIPDAVLWNAFKRITAGYSIGEKNRLFRDTAREFYHLR